VTFGDASPPIELYDGPTDRRSVKTDVSSGKVPDETAPNPGQTGKEDKSLRNVSRGDKIRTCDFWLPNVEGCSSQLLTNPCMETSCTNPVGGRNLS